MCELNIKNCRKIANSEELLYNLEHWELVQIDDTFIIRDSKYTVLTQSLARDTQFSEPIPIEELSQRINSNYDSKNTRNLTPEL